MKPMPDWKELCAELASKLREYDSANPYHDCAALLARADAALAAEPQGEGPTDEELESVARLAEIQSLKEQGGLTAKDANGVAAILQRQRLAGLRAVLARWGRPAQPLPPAAEGAWAAVASFAQDMRSRGLAEQAAGDELLKLANHALATEARAYLAQPAPPADGEVAKLAEWLQKDGMKLNLRPAVQLRILRAADLLQQQHPQPVPVSERLPGANTKVLAHYFNSHGKGRTICAIWVPAKSRRDSGGEEDFTEYDEETDAFYWPEGWYEVIENGDDLGYVSVYEGDVSQWQPLPQWPALPLPTTTTEAP